MMDFRVAARLLGPAAVLTLLSTFAGCQHLFGDYDVAPPAPPPGPQVCESRAYRCDGARLERCSDDRTRWELASTCASESECNLNSQTCRPCTPGEFMCNGEQLLKCDAAATFQLQQSCASAALCSVSAELAHATGSCKPALCTPGSSVCHKAELLQCSAGGDSWEPREVCASAGVCQATVLNNPGADRCERASCSPNEFTCQGGNLLRCNAIRTGWDTIAPCDAASCSAATGSCGPCTPGTVECNLRERRSCTPAGTWETLELCEVGTRCDAAQNVCARGGCPVPGQRRCSPDAPTARLEECGDDFEWQLLDVCASMALCDVTSQGCQPEGCQVNEARCAGDALQACRGDAVGFETIQTCPAGTCDPVMVRCGSRCSDGEQRCNDVHLETCADGSWQRQNTCASPGLCGASGCAEPLCGGSLGSYRCEDFRLLACSGGGSGWSEVEYCNNPMLCEPGLPIPGSPLPGGARVGFGTGACHTCIPGTLSCMGNQLHACQSDGESAKIADCANGCVSTPPGPRCNP